MGGGGGAKGAEVGLGRMEMYFILYIHKGLLGRGIISKWSRGFGSHTGLKLRVDLLQRRGGFKEFRITLGHGQVAFPRQGKSDASKA